MSHDRQRPPPVVRRALSIALVWTACALVWALAPAMLMLALLADLGLRRRFVLVRTYAMMMIALAVESVGIVLALGLGLALALGLPRASVLAWSFRSQSVWIAALARSAFRIFDVRIEVEGADAIGDGPVLVFMRHASTADTLLPGLLVAIPRGIVLRYVLKHELRWHPCIDIVGGVQLGSYFVRRGGHSKEEIEAVGRLAEQLGRGGVLIYPEGTRYGPDKRARIIARLEAEGDAIGLARACALTHVLPPRHGGPLALIEHGPDIDVLFCAHTGFEGTTSFGSLLRGRLIGSVVRVRFWRVPAREIPDGREARIAWLHAQWLEVNAFVAAHAQLDE